MLSGGGPRDRPAKHHFGTFGTQCTPRRVQSCARRGHVVDNQNPLAASRASRPERRTRQPFASCSTGLRNRTVSPQERLRRQIQLSCDFARNEFRLVVTASTSVQRRCRCPRHDVDTDSSCVAIIRNGLRQQRGEGTHHAARVVVLQCDDHVAGVACENGCGGDAVLQHDHVCAQTHPAPTRHCGYGRGMHDAATPRPLRERFFERLVRCAAGLFCFGAGIACFVHSDLGVPPWDVLHTGISKITGLQLGNVIIVVGVALLVLWIPLRIRPGIGTIMNAIQIGLVENFMEDVLPDSRAIAARVAYLAAGMLFIAFGSGLYIGAELGSGPRDGLMIGVNKRFGISIRLARTIVEIVVMVTGIFLGGRIGLGTFVFAFGIGPMVQVAMAALRMSPSLADEATGEALET